MRFVFCARKSCHQHHVRRDVVISCHVAISARTGVGIAWSEQNRSLGIELVRSNAIRSCCVTIHVVTDILADRSVRRVNVIARFNVVIGNVI